MKRIEWLCAVPNCTLELLQKSSMASLRIRTAIAVQAAMQRGYETILSDGHKINDSSIVFVTKIDCHSDSLRSKRWEEYIKKSKNSGVTIVIDYTDHHLIHDTPVADFYRKILPLANHVICSSQALADHIKDLTPGKKWIIEDPIEIDIIKPKNEPTHQLTGLWFGHASNIKYLIEYLLAEYRSEHNYRLILMSNSYPLHQDYTNQLSSKNLQPLEIHVLPWSISNMVEISKISDFCLLPTGKNDLRKNGASSNRLITALALGLPVAADTLLSYAPFREYYAELRSNEFENLLESPNAYADRVLSAQKIIQEKFSTSALSESWMELINSEFIKDVLQKSAQ
jgi:hypothetical protein